MANVYEKDDSISNEYWAGLFDGEGCVLIHKLRGVPTTIRCQLCQKGSFIIRLAKSYWGGAIAKRNQEGNYWNWVIDGSGAERFLKAIRPYSVIKRTQIECALEYYTMFKMGGTAIRKGKKLTNEAKEKRIAFSDDLIRLRSESKVG